MICFHPLSDQSLGSMCVGVNKANSRPGNQLDTALSLTGINTVVLLSSSVQLFVY